MKVIGYSEHSFTAKDTGALIVGMYIYVTYENKRTTGLACDRFFISQKRLEECGYFPSLDDAIQLVYNKYGKITGILMI